MYTYIWEYIVKQEQLSKFTDIYGSNGNWEKLFKLNKGYVKTELLRDIINQKKFVTIDYWKTKQEYDKFRSKYNEEFEILDEECEFLTNEENFIGSFENLS